MMNFTDLYLALAALLGALIALAVYHYAVVKPGFARMAALLATHDGLIGGGAGAGGRLESVEAAVAKLSSASERVTSRVGELESLARVDVSKVGFVRYDAFDDTGSELSYAMALLNREGDGVVLSSIYSRTDTRTYGKIVGRYKPAVNASDEELKAIELARGATAGA